MQPEFVFAAYDSHESIRPICLSREQDKLTMDMSSSSLFLKYFLTIAKQFET